MKKAEGSIADLDPPPPRGDLDKPGHRSWIVVSPDGVLYHADKEVGKVWWGCPTGKGIYNVDREEYVNDYVDLGPADNDTDMYRWYKPHDLELERELIYYNKEEELRGYLNSVYAETTTVSKKDSEIYVNYKTGKTQKARSKDVLLVKRTDYYLQKNSPRPWSLRFTNFLVYFPTKFKDLETERTRCVVRHTRNFEEFVEVCYKYQISRLPNGGFLNTLISSSRKIEMPYRPPNFAKGNHGTVFVRGTFEGFEVLVKMVKKNQRDLRSVIDNYRSVHNHESIVTLHACESDAKFYYFAMEECKYSLREHVAEERYREMDDKSMKIMRSLVAGVAHMHGRMIVHRNLNPKNILVGYDDTAKICGFGNSILQIPGQPDGMPTEMYAVGLVLLYYMSDGNFLFQDAPDYEGSLQSYEKSFQKNNASRKGTLADMLRKNRFNYEGYDLLLKLLVAPEHRLTAKDVLKHPRFWIAITRLSFFKDVSDHLREGEPSEQFKADLGKFDKELREIRNEYNHMRVGYDEKYLEEFYRQKNPRLLMNVYYAVEPFLEIPKLAKYYDPVIC